MHRTKCHVLYTVHIRPECEITYSIGAAPTESMSKESSDKIHNQQMKTWDTRMTTLEGELVINSKFIP
jgi:hypothetical protein